jgi:hypothetical protein
MRIALCMSGYLAGGDRAAHYIQNNLLTNTNIDIFVHSWDVPNEHKIKSYYGHWLKDVTLEPQYDFSNEISLLGGDWSRAPAKKLNVLSSAYGRQQSIKLKEDYERTHNFIYDWVIYSRFDLGVRDRHREPRYRCCEIVFDKNYDNKYLYTKYWPQLNQGFADMWLYSNSINMDLYATYYDKIFEYSKNDSEYLKAMTTGWPDSNKDQEFSNEIFKKEKSNNLTTFPLNWAMGNNHTMLKWFLIDKGLYPNKLRFPVNVGTYKFNELTHKSISTKLIQRSNNV